MYVICDKGALSSSRPVRTVAIKETVSRLRFSCDLGPDIWSLSYERFTADDAVPARPSTITAAIANTFEKRLHLIALLLGSGISRITLSRK
jgi:hypothetical protein